MEVKLTRPTAFPAELIAPLRQAFDRLYRPGVPFRQTGVVLAGLIAEESVQYSLFDDMTKVGKLAKVYGSLDELAAKFGKHAVQHASSLPTKVQAQHEGARGDVPVRRGALFKGENKRQRLGLPLLHIKV